MKLCRKCGEEKHEMEFHKQSDKPDGLRTTCKNCTNGANLNRYKTSEKTRAAHSKAARKYSLQKFYGITQEEYDLMYQQQGGKCRICRCEEGGRRFHVDHCHNTNKVRGLLCNLCNKGLGCFKDNTSILEEAIKYLRG